jgi:hypothetical protein
MGCFYLHTWEHYRVRVETKGRHHPVPYWDDINKASLPKATPKKVHYQLLPSGLRASFQHYLNMRPRCELIHKIIKEMKVKESV